MRSGASAAVPTGQVVVTTRTTAVEPATAEAAGHRSAAGPEPAGEPRQIDVTRVLVLELDETAPPAAVAKLFPFSR